jgi:Rrf2 family protein
MKSLLNITEATTIAIHTLSVLAATPTGIVRSTADIAARLQVSEAHLAKVLQRLHRAGFVRAVRGPSGGFSLARNPEQVTMLEVYELFEGPLREATCLLELPRCRKRDCCFRQLLTKINSQVREHLATTRLSDVAHVFPCPE